MSSSRALVSSSVGAHLYQGSSLGKVGEVVQLGQLVQLVQLGKLVSSSASS